MDGVSPVYIWSAVLQEEWPRCILPQIIFSVPGHPAAVFGLIGAVLGYLLRHHRQLPENERNKLYGSVAWFFAANTIFAWWFNSAFEGMKIGIEAHTGGFIAGLLAGLVLASKLCRQEELSEFAEDL